jgi:site-specific DNA-methyltransferase (adenine-specific)
MGLAQDHEFNLRWLRAARRILNPDGTLWVTGTHHIIFGVGFALRSLGFKIIKVPRRPKGDCFSNH